MKFFVLLKVVLATYFQIEFAPQFWREMGFTKGEVRIIVMGLSLVILMINIFILNLGVHVLETTNSKKSIRYKITQTVRFWQHKIAKIIHLYGPLGLFVSGLIPLPPILGAAQPLAYLLYCGTEEKVWYKPNIGLLSLMLGVLTKMFLLT